MKNKIIMLSFSLLIIAVSEPMANAAELQAMGTLDAHQMVGAKLLANAITYNNSQGVADAFANYFKQGIIRYENPLAALVLTTILNVEVKKLIGKKLEVIGGSLQEILKNEAALLFSKIIDENRKNILKSLTQKPATDLFGAFGPVGKDIILQIAASLPEADLSHLAQASSEFRKILQPILEEQNLVRQWSCEHSATQRLLGHTDVVTVLAFSPDGKMVASGADDNKIIIWNAKTGVVKNELKGHTRPITSLDFSPDGTSLVSASLDGTIRLWDVNKALELNQLRGNVNHCNSAKFSHNGRFLAFTYKKTLMGYNVKVRNLKTGNEMMHSAARDILQISFSPDDEILAIFAGTNDPKIFLWNYKADTERKDRKFEIMAGADINDLFRSDDRHCPYSVIFSPDLKLCAASFHQTLRVQNVNDGTELFTVNNHTFIEPIAVSAGNKVLAYAGRFLVHLINIKNHVNFKDLTFKDVVCALSFSPDGKTLAVGFVDGTILLITPEY